MMRQQAGSGLGEPGIVAKGPATPAPPRRGTGPRSQPARSRRTPRSHTSLRCADLLNPSPPPFFAARDGPSPSVEHSGGVWDESSVAGLARLLGQTAGESE